MVQSSRRSPASRSSPARAWHPDVAHHDIDRGAVPGDERFAHQLEEVLGVVRLQDLVAVAAEGGGEEQPQLPVVLGEQHADAGRAGVDARHRFRGRIQDRGKTAHRVVGHRALSCGERSVLQAACRPPAAVRNRPGLGAGRNRPEVEVAVEPTRVGVAGRNRPGLGWLAGTDPGWGGWPETDPGWGGWPEPTRVGVADGWPAPTGRHRPRLGRRGGASFPTRGIPPRLSRPSRRTSRADLSQHAFERLDTGRLRQVGVEAGRSGHGHVLGCCVAAEGDQHDMAEHGVGAQRAPPPRSHPCRGGRCRRAPPGA